MAVDGQEPGAEAKRAAELYADALRRLFEPARERGAKQTALAKMMKRDTSVISRWLNGVVVAPSLFIDAIVACRAAWKVPVDEHELGRIHDLREAAQKVSNQRRAQDEYLKGRIAELKSDMKQYKARFDEECRLLRDQNEALVRGRDDDAMTLAALRADRDARIDQLSFALAAAAAEVVTLRAALRVATATVDAEAEHGGSGELVLRQRGQLELARGIGRGSQEDHHSAGAALDTVEQAVVALRRQVDLFRDPAGFARLLELLNTSPAEPPNSEGNAVVADATQARTAGPRAEDQVPAGRNPGQDSGWQPLYPADAAASVPQPAPRTRDSGADDPDTSSSDGWWEALYSSVRDGDSDTDEAVADPATHTTPVEPRLPYRREGFGWQRGVTVAVAAGTPVRAIAAGLVVAAVCDPYGNEVIIRHEDDMFSVYGNLSLLSVRRGQAVRTGQPIGDVGSSGRTNEQGLRFEVCTSWHEDGTRNGIDPVAYLWHCGVNVDGIRGPGQKLPDESIFRQAVHDFASAPPSEHANAGAALTLMVIDCPYIRPRVMDILTSYLRPPPQGHRQRSPEFHTAAQWLLQGVLATADRRMMIDLSGADLWNLSFTGGWFLPSINFENACLVGAEFTGCDMRESHFFNADLTGTDLRGANLSSTTGLTAAALSKAEIDTTTRMPTQFKADFEDRHRSKAWKVFDTSPVSVGRKLTQVRLYRRQSIDQISESTGIPVPTLRLIETGDYSPDRIPALGEPLRLYAQALGMNPEPLLAELNHHAAGPTRK
ncbi:MULTISPECIES: peptidoglycan DD-metalloendopeptidase family protein [unclassified Streptomyces]|uniref:peptidoglycan DD-metalloendopeptidase family protein n=1 Tax=Streptomyces sp. NPDC017949 TaxID=3365020 RepID=UPI0037B2C7A8